MAYTSGDPVALAKALTAYAKANPAFTFKAGMVEGRVIDVKAINDLATMPSKEEIFAQVAVSDQRSGTAAGDGDERAWAAIWRWWWIRASRKTSFRRRPIRSRAGLELAIFEDKEFKKWRTSTQLRNRFRA